MNTKKEKIKLREIVNTRINELDKDYIKFSDKKIFENIISLSEFKKAKTVFLFASVNKEIDTFNIIEYSLKNGKNVVLPLCTGKGIMEARQIKGLEDLSKGSYGIMEPKQSCPVIDKNDIDFAIVPCVSCNLKGERLGHGGGYYDRFMKECKFKKAVICREKLMLNFIPMNIYDVKMDIVINENKIKRFK